MLISRKFKIKMLVKFFFNISTLAIIEIVLVHV